MWILDPGLHKEMKVDAIHREKEQQEKNQACKFYFNKQNFLVCYRA